VITKEKLPALLVFFSILYLICSPSFSIYVQWASCLEHFIAIRPVYYQVTFCILQSNIKWKDHHSIFSCRIFCGTCDLLFTYQNGLGLFFFLS
jgi:hypothetical protein